MRHSALLVVALLLTVACRSMTPASEPLPDDAFAKIALQFET